MMNFLSTDLGFEKPKIHTHCSALFVQKEVAMAGSFGSLALVFFKSDDGLIEIRAKIRIAGTNDCKLDFRL